LEQQALAVPTKGYTDTSQRDDNVHHLSCLAASDSNSQKKAKNKTKKGGKLCPKNGFHSFISHL